MRKAENRIAYTDNNDNNNDNNTSDTVIHSYYELSIPPHSVFFSLCHLLSLSLSLSLCPCPTSFHLKQVIV